MDGSVNSNVFTAALLKREDCKRTKHDSAFSQWKILVGPSDWEDYLLNKEGAEKYRTRNLPNCSSCPGLYELGIAVSLPRTEGKSSNKLGLKSIIPVYLGQADNVRTRLQQYGRDGAHLENGCSNREQVDQKVLRLFSDIFSSGYPIAFRWAPMETKKEAEKTESQILRDFDYAWNRWMNGERRPGDILRKLNVSASNAKRVPGMFTLPNFRPKKVGLDIKRCDSHVLDNGSSFYTKQEDNNILSRIIKFSRTRPILVSNEDDMNNNVICGVALGHGSICTRPPVEGRKRCDNHKGMKVNAFVRPNFMTNMEDTLHLTCGVTLDDASFCTRVPVAGRKRCEEHKGRRTGMHIPSPFIAQEKQYAPSSGLELEMSKKTYEEHKRMMDGGNKSKILFRDADSWTCVAITQKGSFCSRKPSEGSKFCWQHEAMGGGYKPKILFRDAGADSLTCAAITQKGSYCRRKPCEGSRFCWQH